GGRTHQLALDEPSAGNAIHGLVRWDAWTVAERETSRVVLKHTLYPQPGYPFGLAISIEYALTPAGLHVRTRASDRGGGPCTSGDRPDVRRRRIAVEPMPCPPNAFRSGDDLIVLEPGAHFDGAWGITPL